MTKIRPIFLFFLVSFGVSLFSTAWGQTQRPPKSRIFQAPDCFVPQALADQKNEMVRAKDPLEPFLEVILRGVTPWPDIFGRWRNNSRDLRVEVSARSEKINENFEVSLKFSSLCKPKLLMGQLELNLPWTVKKDHKYQTFISKIEGPLFAGLEESGGDYWVQIKPLKIKPQGTDLEALKHLSQIETLRFLDLTIWKSSRPQTQDQALELLGGKGSEQFNIVDAFLVEQF